MPVRYLGVPLASKKMTKTDYQPLLDKITARFNFWTSRHLSFAGRFQLIQTVIFSTISFWASIFVLPKQCIAELGRLCNAFLWRGNTSSARGAKVAWDSVCTSKESGGLGLKRLAEWNTVLGLKLIWLLFASSGSLWVSWVCLRLIGERNFWELDATSAGSWVWRSICKLRDIARPFVVCEVGSGISASFWLDNWTGRGPLIDIAGAFGPMLSGLSLSATVAEALTEEGWWLDRSRSRNPTLLLIKNCLPDAATILESEVDDRYLWQTGSGPPKDSFSTSATWKTLHPDGEVVPWCDQVWFAGRIPKHAFITWLVARDRMSTRDRLISWGGCRSRQCAFCAMLVMRIDSIYSLTVLIPLRCGLSSVTGYISHLPHCLTMV